MVSIFDYTGEITNVVSAFSNHNTLPEAIKAYGAVLVAYPSEVFRAYSEHAARPPTQLSQFSRAPL